MGHVQNMHGLCMQYVDGIGHGAVLRAVCRIAALRVLTAYIPRTPGPKKASRAWLEPGLLPFGAMEYAWNMYGICMEYIYVFIWNMYGI